VIEHEFPRTQAMSTLQKNGTPESLFFILASLIAPNIVFINTKKAFFLLAIVQFAILLYGFVDVELALIMYLSYAAVALSFKFSAWVFYANFK